MVTRYLSRLFRRLVTLAALLAVGLYVGGSSIAWAHALLLRADPAEGTIVPSSPPIIHLWFSEDLNGSASKIVVWDRYRHVMSQGNATLVPGQPRQMEVRLKLLPKGSYLVLWTSVSAQDGHILHGYYLFSVKARGPGPSLAGVSSNAGSQTFPDAAGLATLLAHWLELLGVTLWVGSVGFVALVLPAVADRFTPTVRDVESGRRRVVVRVAIVGMVLASCAVVVLQAYSLAGGVWSAAFSGSIWRSIFSVQYGQLWVARQGIALLALAATFLVPQERAVATWEQRQMRAGERGALDLTRPTPIFLGFVYLYLLAASGHAASSSVGVVLGSHILTGAVAVDWLHLIGVSLWFGGQLYIFLVLIPAVRAAHDLERTTRPFLDALNRFSPIAYASVALFTLSGPFNGAIHIPSWYAFFNSVYGRTLIIKIVLIGLMMLTSAGQVFLLRPNIGRVLQDERPDRWETVRRLMNRLFAWLRIEPALGCGVLLATSVLFYYPVPAGFGPAGSSAYVVQAAGLTASVRVTPDHSGPNQVTVMLKDRAGKPVQQASITILTEMLDMVMGLGVAPLHQTAPGTFTGTADLAMGGRWRLQLLIYTPSGLTRMNVVVRVGT